ncbi:hypothetical protein Nepgr_009217 [Nepenthes gracilis]|uniref:dolichyl-P-Man:Man5GlcNAc2-PP-dolichol alpha-1,3-mannosyltransferase n=1 Tax=Nepenthes gracilis TaxID=150966 RepID=A0AAD3XJY6_NEPGR|nr:hypothetical protein Nepgr_009217 [Nepenthes gracilis]
MTIPQHASNWPVAELDGEPVAELDSGRADWPVAESNVAELDGEPVADLDGGRADWPVAELDGKPIAVSDDFQLPFSSPCLLEEQSGGPFEEDLENKQLGDGVPWSGFVQDEVYFMVNPDLMASMFSLPVMSANVVIHPAQMLFGVLYIVNLAIILFIDVKTDLLPGFPYQSWHWGLIMFGVAVFINMNVFLNAPPLLLLLLKALNFSGMILALIGAATVQILLELPFFVSHLKAYITEADNLRRVFNFKFVPEPIFVSKFAISLLIVHLGLLLASAHYKWCKHKRGIVKFWCLIYASMKLNQQLYTTSKALKNDHIHRLWHLGDELRGHPRVSEDHQWLLVISKLAEQTKFKGEWKRSALTNSATTYSQLTITPVLEPSLEDDSTTLLAQNPLLLAVSSTIITALSSLLSTFRDHIMSDDPDQSLSSFGVTEYFHISPFPKK